MSVMSPLNDSAQSGGRAYSGRMTEQSLTVQPGPASRGGLGGLAPPTTY